MQFPVAVANIPIAPPLTAPLTVNFIGSGSYDPDGSVAEYNWNFGDGSAASSISDPVHTYFTAQLLISQLKTRRQSLWHQLTKLLVLHH